MGLAAVAEAAGFQVLPATSVGRRWGVSHQLVHVANQVLRSVLVRDLEVLFLWLRSQLLHQAT